MPSFYYRDIERWKNRTKYSIEREQERIKTAVKERKKSSAQRLMSKSYSVLETANRNLYNNYERNSGPYSHVYIKYIIYI